METFVLTLDAGGTFLKAGIFCGTEIIPETVTSVSVNSNGTLEEVYAAYLQILNEMKHCATEHGITLSGVCVDIPGPFDYQNGISRMRHKYTAIYGIQLRSWFAEVFGELPVIFLHDSAAFISGAATMSDTPDANIAGVMIGTGLGFALMEHRTVCLNENGGPLISVYNRPYRDGIAEDYVSGRGIVTAYRNLTGNPDATAKKIGQLADLGDPCAIRVYEEMGHVLGEILRDILSERKTEILYLGGQISRSFSIFGPPLRRSLQSVETLKRIEPAYNLGNIHLIGAAQYWKTVCEKNGI